MPPLSWTELKAPEEEEKKKKKKGYYL